MPHFVKSIVLKSAVKGSSYRCLTKCTYANNHMYEFELFLKQG